MATHSSVLAWRIPGTGEPGGLPSMGLHRVGHKRSNLAPAAAAEADTVSLFLSFGFLFCVQSTFSLTMGYGVICMLH